MKRILFVCLGNICRSPLAEGVFLHLAQQAGRSDEFEVDSCGTGGWHAGEHPDPRSQDTARAHGIKLNHRARQFDRSDFKSFDLIITMDRDNKSDLLSFSNLKPEERAKIKLLREYDPKANGDLDVPDPYYGGADGFEQVYRMVERAGKKLLESL
ncbi:MAG: low molecular weight phosphotyrosine protein phosphatase [Chloroflexi bacterium]|nr:low molecular weight phosphotyrosine protein phosphatase [Chloroflexota bacterium]